MTISSHLKIGKDFELELRDYTLSLRWNHQANGGFAFINSVSGVNFTYINQVFVSLSDSFSNKLRRLQLLELGSIDPFMHMNLANAQFPKTKQTTLAFQFGTPNCRGATHWESQSYPFVKSIVPIELGIWHTCRLFERKYGFCPSQITIPAELSIRRIPHFLMIRHFRDNREVINLQG